MKLERSLQDVRSSAQDGDFRAEVSFNRLERRFTESTRELLLYSDVHYTAGSFEWESTLPTVRIPYRDPSLGFLVNGVVFSAVGIYSRAPGVVADLEKNKVDIVNAQNATVAIGYKRNAVHIVFKRGDKKHKVPIGIFLKALSRLPYAEILKGFAYAPQSLLNAFPCKVPEGNEDLSKAELFGIDSDEEPTIDDCINAVYNAVTQSKNVAGDTKYTTYWRVNRINSFLDNLQFKIRTKYESTLSLGNRAVGTYLDEDLDVPYFEKVEKVTEKLLPNGSKVTQRNEEVVVSHFILKKGHFITDDDARSIRRFDVSQLRVRTSRGFVLQEGTPMLFRAKGYKLANDIPECQAYAGEIIDEDLLQRINDTRIVYLDVLTPGGRKVLHRSLESVEVGDFYTILNYLFTFPLMKNSDTTQYEVGNRVIYGYDRQVIMEVEQVYQEICNSILGSTKLKNLLNAIPSLPSSKLVQYLRDPDNKAVTQSDITNIMSRAIADTKASALIPEAPNSMMMVQKGQYGRLDALHTPDSNKVGSVQHQTAQCRINPDTGEIEAPYEKITNGQPTGQIVWVNASKENNKYIVAWNEDFSAEVVMARCNGDVTTVARERVDYRDPSPFCDMSVSRICIPFPGFSQPKRAIMATKMNGQALPILFPERPYVSTGAETEIPALCYTGRDIIESNNCEVVDGATLELIGHSWGKNLVTYRFIYNRNVLDFSVPFTATDKESLYNYNLNLTGSKVYGVDEVILYNQSCDLRKYDYWTRMEQGSLPLVKDHTKPALALGTNLYVGFKTYGSSTVDDALTISDRLVKDMAVSHIQIFKYSYKLRQGESFRDVYWGAELHSHVYEGMPIIHIQRMKDNDTTAERGLRCRQEGEVVYAAKSPDGKEAEVWVATIHNAEVGDKMAGRYGDKAVIAKIVPQEMMPYDPEVGRALDVVLTPLGVPSRMNYGRILEVALGAVMHKQGKRAVVTPFFPNIKEDIESLYKEAGLKPTRLYNPVYGKMTERPVMTGYLYMMKLEQIANLKMSSVGYPVAVDPVFAQPTDSINYDKGQAIGEMESWALIASGAHHILNTFHGIYADDADGRKAYFDALSGVADNADSPWDEQFLPQSKHSVNRSALSTQLVMRMFGLDLVVSDNRYHIKPLNLDDIEVELQPHEFANGFEHVPESQWFKVRLTSPVVNPFWIRNFPMHIVLGVHSLKSLLSGKMVLNLNRLNDRENCIVSPGSLLENERTTALTGIEAVIKLMRETPIEDAIARIQAKYMGDSTESSAQPEGNAGAFADADDDSALEGEALEFDSDGLPSLGDLTKVPLKVADVLRLLRELQKDGKELTSLIWYEMPIMPRIFRQSNIVGDRDHKHSFQLQLENICSAHTTPQGIYSALESLIGYGDKKKDDLVSIFGYFFGKDSQTGEHGKIRSAVLSKRVGFSGRMVITPMADPTISPFFVCLPWRAAVIQLGKQLGIRLSLHAATLAEEIHNRTGFNKILIDGLEADSWQKIVESLGSFNPYILSNYFGGMSNGNLLVVFNYLREVVREYIEGNVTPDGLVYYEGEWYDPSTIPRTATIDCAIVEVGRQPTLHKRSIRSFFVKLCDGWCMQVHHTVCNAYNADFDGDTMWDAQLLGEDKVESCCTTSVMHDLISEKDGSYTLDLSQDIVLGLYCATTFKDNVKEFTANIGEFYFFDNAEELRAQLEYGNLHYYDAVVFHNKENGGHYCSTAGRILINSVVPGAMTLKPFTDSYGIFKAVFGEEYKQGFNELLYDIVLTSTSITAKGYERTYKVSDIQLSVYNTAGDRASVMVTQALYEIGMVASDIYSVSLDLRDMSTSVDVEQFMDAPRQAVERLNSLYELGLMTEESRKLASVRAWDNAKKTAQGAILNALSPTANMFYMMYSGSRGKPDQIMQSVGFIGNISKNKTEDIEFPILKGYGRGLSSLDLAQTSPSARLGVIATQAGTRDPGYATRQSVYMTSGFTVKEKDCGISINSSQVMYDQSATDVIYADGTMAGLDSLVGRFIESSSSAVSLFEKELRDTGYAINEDILHLIISHGVTELMLTDGPVRIKYKLDPEWREYALDVGYSYCLPYTKDFKITEETLQWIEEQALQQIVAVNDVAVENGTMLDNEAYLPVDYDTMQYVITVNGQKIDAEALFAEPVSELSPGFYYYKNLLTSGGLLTETAVKYLTKKCLPEVLLSDGTVAKFTYKLSSLFKKVTLGRISAGLLYLDRDSLITEQTLQSVEELQLKYIPVRTGMTCLTVGGICACCYGRSLYSKSLPEVGVNLGIAASQAMCEPLSQASLNVGHSGGRRSAGLGAISGLSYYMKLVKGSPFVSKSSGDNGSLEQFADVAGYFKQDVHNAALATIVTNGGEQHRILTSDGDRFNVPDGAYVDIGDTVVVGLPDIRRYDSTDVFHAAIKMRYMLIQEYNRVFDGLGVSPRNAEVIARAQTSICYLNAPGSYDKTKDTSVEAQEPTGKYKLTISHQMQVVQHYTGVAAFGFENVASMLLMGVTESKGLPLNSCLGNLITGTTVGAVKPEFISKHGGGKKFKYHKSSVRAATNNLAAIAQGGDYDTLLQLGSGEQTESGYADDVEAELFAKLFSDEPAIDDGGHVSSSMQALPDAVESPDAVETPGDKGGLIVDEPEEPGAETVEESVVGTAGSVRSMNLGGVVEGAVEDGDEGAIEVEPGVVDAEDSVTTGFVFDGFDEEEEGYKEEAPDTKPPTSDGGGKTPPGKVSDMKL